MATKFLEPGGDATLDLSLFTPNSGAPAVVSDIVHGGHLRSVKYPAGASNNNGLTAVAADAGGRFSVYMYVNAQATATCSFFDTLTTGFGTGVLVFRLTSAGVIQLFSGGVQLGSNGPTLATGRFYRLAFAWTITNSTTFTAKVWVDGVLGLTVTNTGTLAGTGSADMLFGNISGDATLDTRWSDFYVDDSNTLTDPGNIWVTAKRPNANGSVNGFTTQIGVGGSGYGTGHSPQVNERALSTTNGWSMVGAGSAVTEEYTVESASTGDIDITRATLIDYMGWVYAKSALAETASIVVGGVSTNISLTNADTMFRKVAGSVAYPAGGTDIGIVTSTTVTTVSLTECGLIMAVIFHSPSDNLLMMGA